ncbi:MAG: single-stranded-DNA-specific exonuclease RecJ [Gemmatimonadaceae bacterium]|nr:single-stranded-DNA-specific exonuclease RecJ [Gemmatimonadaceae bacterium]
MTHARPAARWEGVPAAPAGVAEALAEALRPGPERAGTQAVPLAVCRLLAARGIRTVDEAKRFLRPALEHIEAPDTMLDLGRAADRLAAAARAGEVVLVHGDYDVDGICSTTLMTRALRRLGARAVPFIPDRIADGYDLGPAGVRAAEAAGARVVLTCDCGTTALQPARDLAARGIDLIVTDHHLPGAELPEAYALVNPRRPGCPSADKDLAAVGVAYKLALAVTRRLGGDEGMVHEMLDLVALATIADVAPLRGENRVMVRHGLKRMAESRHIGLRALIRAARLDGKPLTAGRVGYTLAPRLNALGRLRRAIRGVELLLAEDEATANAIARECEELNEHRQSMDRAILDEAMRRIDAMDLDATWGLVLDSTAWHPGVIGIVASRVVERTARPAMLIAVQDGVGKGSGRSIGAFDLHQALQACSDLLVKHGGHRAAAGLTIAPARIPAFAERFDAVAHERLTREDLVPRLRTDLELGLDEADEAFERSLRHLEPFGVGNPGPVLVARDVRVVGSPRRVGADGLKLALETGRGTMDGLGWGLAARAGELRAGARVDLAYRLDVNEYQGARTLQAVVQDFRVRAPAGG